jgi:predicted DNA-binding protein
MDERAITFRLPEELHERLRRVAFDLRVSMNSIITEGTERRVAELEAKVREGGQP